MKILVLSLLRIGDVVLSAPVLRGLRERHPNAEIHLLINSQFMQIAPLMPYVNRVIPFERERLQKGLGDANVPVFDSYARLESSIEQLNAEKYDWMINLTQSRLSGWVMSLVEAKTRSGLVFDAQGRASFGSSWFKYLNSQVDAEGAEVFHFTDVFRFALELGEEVSPRAVLNETIKGRCEADELLNSMGNGEGGLIAVQPLTSDVKKDWGLSRFHQALVHVQRLHPQIHFAILGAPFESERLSPFVDGLQSAGVKAYLAITSFEGAFSLLRKSKLLITGDTSVKHLACAARTPVVEISLGSSDIHRTGAYLHGSVIIQSREACAPCPHSQPCHRESQFCASRISPDVVAMVAGEVAGGRCFQLKTIAEEFREDVDILRVETRALGFWAAPSVLETFSENSIGRWIDLACRKVWLETERGGTYEMMGTEILRLSRLLHSVHPEVSEIEWRHLLADFERQAIGVEGRINGFKIGLQYLRGCYEDKRRMNEFVRGLISFRERIRHAPLLRSFKSALDQVIEDDISPAFTRFRRMSDLIGEIERRTEIHLRLIRGLARQNEAEKGLEQI